jgi:phosphomannomutase/phosphoglucomutase
MHDSIFRKYDLRGKVDSELPLDEIYNLTHAIVAYYRSQCSTLTTVALGADGRTHSPAIKERVIAGLQDAGISVIDIGMCPTPVLYAALHTLNVQGGIMITASHNGPAYNGFKLCLGTSTIWGEQIIAIKNLFQQKIQVSNAVRGTYTTYPMITDYIALLKKQFAHLIGMELSAIIDCGNGAAGTVLPALIQEMKWPNVKLLYEEVDGTYPHHEADPTVVENMQDLAVTVKRTGATIGIGLDGDCDRMAPVTHAGELVLGDRLLALFAQPLTAEYPALPIICDIKCSAGLLTVLKEWGAQPILSPSGHSIIKQQMKEHDALLAGELSCHFFFKDRYFGFDDGIYAACRLFELLLQTNKSLHELLQVVPSLINTHEMRIPCEDSTQALHALTAYYAQRPDASLILIDGVRVMFADGWGMVRGSNTQPVICLRFEATTHERLEAIKDEFYALLKEYIDPTILLQEMSHA